MRVFLARALLGGLARKIRRRRAPGRYGATSTATPAAVGRRAVPSGRAVGSREIDGGHARRPDSQAPAPVSGWSRSSPAGHRCGSRWRAVVVVSDERSNAHEFVKVDLVTGAETQLVEHVPTVFDEAGSSLALGSDGESVLANVPAESGGPLQVARLRLADGAMTWLTADLDEYTSVSVARDSLVTTGTEVRKRFWVGDAAGRDVQAVGPEVVSDRGDSLIAWAGQNRILYVAPLPGGSGVGDRSRLRFVPARARRLRSGRRDGRWARSCQPRPQGDVRRADSDGRTRHGLRCNGGSSAGRAGWISCSFYISGPVRPADGMEGGFAAERHRRSSTRGSAPAARGCRPTADGSRPQ